MFNFLYNGFGFSAQWHNNGEKPHAWRQLPPLNFEVSPVFTLGSAVIFTYGLLILLLHKNYFIRSF